LPAFKLVVEIFLFVVLGLAALAVVMPLTILAAVVLAVLVLGLVVMVELLTAAHRKQQ